MNILSIHLPEPPSNSGNKMEIEEGNKLPYINEGNKMPYQPQPQQYEQQQQPNPPPIQNIIPDSIQPPPVAPYQYQSPPQMMGQSINPPMPPTQEENVPPYIDSNTKQMKILFRPIEDFSVFAW